MRDAGVSIGRTFYGVNCQENIFLFWRKRQKEFYGESVSIGTTDSERLNFVPELQRGGLESDFREDQYGMQTGYGLRFHNVWL